MLAWVPETDSDVVWQSSLKESIRREEETAKTLDMERNRAALNLLHMAKLQKQLNHKEKKKSKDNDRLTVTGNAVCLTAPEALERAKETRDTQNDKEAAKAARKLSKTAVDAQRKAWKAAEEERLRKNREGRAAYNASKAAYEQEKKNSKLTKRPMFLSPPDKFVALKPLPKTWMDKSNDNPGAERATNTGEDENDDGEDDEGSDQSLDEDDQLSD